MSNIPPTKDLIEIVSPDPGPRTDHQPRQRLRRVRSVQRLQDLAAARHHADGTLLPRQLRRTLKDVVEHYRKFFLVVSDPDGLGPGAVADRPDRAGHARHRRLHEAAGLVVGVRHVRDPNLTHA